MDEPTSALTNKEIEKLFDIIHQLKAKGVGIVYISHRLDELKEIADRVTIMRDGHYITGGNFTDMPMEEIIKNMVGREIKEQFPRTAVAKGKKIFSVKNLRSGGLCETFRSMCLKAKYSVLQALWGRQNRNDPCNFRR